MLCRLFCLHYPNQLADRRQGQPKLTGNEPRSLALSNQNRHRGFVLVEAAWTPQSASPSLGCGQTRKNPFLDDFSLEFRHRHQNPHLQPTRWI